MLDRKMKIFKFNSKVKEWCIACNKKEAYKFFVEFWDNRASMRGLYAYVYLKNNPGKDINSFIEDFLIEEKEEILTLPYGDNHEDVTMNIDEWLNLSNGEPVYLCKEKKID